MRRFRYGFLLLLVPFFLACNLSNMIGASSGGRTTPVVGQQPAAALGQLEGQVRQAVTGFLTALQADPGGQSALVYLSDALQQEVNAGTPLPQLLGVQNTIPKYELSAVTFRADATGASVDVTLLYQQPVNLRLHLQKGEAGWKIDTLTPLQGGVSDAAGPEQVVQAFIAAYQETPDEMSKYLSTMRKNQLPPGGAVGMLNISGALEGSMIESAAVNPASARATVTAIVQSGGKGYTRIFTLTLEDGQWKIDTVEGQ